MKIAIIILWVIWGLLLLAWPTDVIIALLSKSGEPTAPDMNLVSILGFVSFILLGLTFVLKWFLFRFLINPKRIQFFSPWATVILVIGSLIIWGFTKAVEIYGFVIFLGSESLPHYLAFWMPSILIMLIHMPFLLNPRRTPNTHAEQEPAPNP